MLNGSITNFIPKPQSYIEKVILTYGSPDAAVEGLRKETKTKPIDSRLDLQVLLNALGREEESFEISMQLVELAPKDPRILFNHGWHWLKRGQMQKGMALLENGRQLETYGHKPIQSIRSLWSPQTGRGHRVHLVLEGGFGDEMIHFRFARDLVEKYDCKVNVICQPTIASLFARSPYVGCVAVREACLGIYHDSWLPGMSAALALGFEFKDISGKPYMYADQTKTVTWRRRLGDTGKLKVGIRWAGNPKFEHQQFRLFPPNILFELRQNPNVQLYSFQKDSTLSRLPEGIIDLAPDLNEWDDTAAALMNMDLMISSCTSVAHLSAGLGKPTWVVVPALPYFVWALPGDTSPWYDSVRLFRQGVFGTWTDVAENLKSALSNWVYLRAIE
jgi:hypothetical protein